MANEFAARDHRWSRAVRESYKGICPCCGYEVEDGQPAHIEGRNNQKTRWVVENGIWACNLLHRKMEMSENAKIKVVKDYVPDEYRYAKIMNVARGISKPEEFGFREIQ